MAIVEKHEGYTKETRFKTEAMYKDWDNLVRIKAGVRALTGVNEIDPNTRQDIMDTLEALEKAEWEFKFLITALEDENGEE